MTYEWITWALQGLIAAVLGTIWKQLQIANKSIVETNASIATLHLDVASNYVKSIEMERVRARLHEIENWRAGVIAERELLRTQHNQRLKTPI
jgi:hypothetical protein